MSLAVAKSDALPMAWWQEMPNRACVMDYVDGERTISVAAELIDPADGILEATTLRFRVVMVSGA
jgi:hypothetical protein